MASPPARITHSRRRVLSIALSAAIALCFALPLHGSRAAEAPRPLTFLVLGDWGRNGQYHQRDVAEQMAKVATDMKASFVIATGDNFYNSGVPSVDAPQWVTSFENIYSQASLLVPWYVVLGNHDYRGSAQAQIDYSKKSKRWRMPARYYAIQEELPDGGEADFFFLDTSPFVKSYRQGTKLGDVAQQDAGAQLRWLDEQLAQSKADWRIVVGHHAVYSLGEEHGDTPELIERLKPVLDRHHVQLYLNGHDHDLQHIVVDGVNYITSGAGSRTRTVGKGPNTRFALGQTSGFVTISLTRNSLAARFIDLTGRERYTFTQKR